MREIGKNNEEYPMCQKVEFVFKGRHFNITCNRKTQNARRKLEEKIITVSTTE